MLMRGPWGQSPKQTTGGVRLRSSGGSVEEVSVPVVSVCYKFIWEVFVNVVLIKGSRDVNVPPRIASAELLCVEGAPAVCRLH